MNSTIQDKAETENYVFIFTMVGIEFVLILIAFFLERRQKSKNKEKELTEMDSYKKLDSHTTENHNESSDSDQSDERG